MGTLESQLKALQKKVDTIVKQRKDLGSSVASFWVRPPSLFLIIIVIVLFTKIFISERGLVHQG